MIEDKKLILGLDVSTTCIGCSLMLVDGDVKKILKVTSISPKINKKIKGVESLFLKKQIFENEFLIQYKDYGITDVVIEEPLLGSNNINVVATLLKFNILVSESIYNVLGLVPNYISSYDARAYAFPELFEVRKFNKKDEIYPTKDIKKALKKHNVVLFGGFKWDVAKKNVLLDKISERFTDIEWIYNDNVELKKENFDASDAAVCCLGYVNKLKHNEVAPIVTIDAETEEYVDYSVTMWDNIYKHRVTFK